MLRLLEAVPLAGPRWGAFVLLAGLGLSATCGASAAEPAYPFEGTWVQADHACSPGSTRVRTYTSRDVTSPRGRCLIRRIATGSGAYELFEECRHEHSGLVTETIRMTSPDSMVLRRQLNRLKIPRQQHFTRCSIAAPNSAPRLQNRPAGPAGEPHRAPADGAPANGALKP
jgi:hypothetical protein